MTLQCTAHNRTFGLVYKGNPKCGNIICRIPISISFQTTVTALKHLATAVRLPFFRVNVMTAAASLGRVSRWDKDNGNSSQNSLVGDKHPELIKRPVVRSSPLSFAAWLAVQGLTNIGQVLKRQCSSHALGLGYQLLSDAVVDVLLEPRLFPGEPLEESSTSSRAFGLKRSPDPRVTVASRLQLATIPSFIGGSCRNVSPTQIDSNHLRSFARWWSVEFNRNLDVIVSTPSLDQCGTSWGLPSQQCQLIIANGQREPDLLRHQRDANMLVGLPISEDSGIQRDAGWAKLVNLLDSLHVAHHSPNGLADMIGFQSSCQPDRVVGQVMQLGGVTAVLAFSYFQYLIASISKSLQGAVNFLAQLHRDLKLARDR